jgi:hypothetical protein
MGQKWTTWLLVFTFLLVLGSYWQLYVLNRTVSGLSDQLQQLVTTEIGSMTHTHVSGGITRTFTTPRLPNESDEDWTERHIEAVRAFLKKFKPD